MYSQLSRVGILAKGIAGIVVAVALTLGMAALIAFQLDQTFSEPRSPSGKRGVVIIESVLPEEVPEQCQPSCSVVSPIPAVASHGSAANADSDT